jgi:hypothetical protein
MMLGKTPPKFNKRTLRLGNYLIPDAPPIPPTKTYWEYKVPAWTMAKNDTVGDCTCAAIAHMVMLWTAHAGAMVTPSDTDVLAVYSAVTGYDPATGLNDNGAAITDVLEYWRTTGIAGHKIDGWASIDNTNQRTVKQAIYLFGGIDIGVNLPNSAMDQTNAKAAWTVLPDDGGIDGGHSIPLFGYGADGTTAVTWGQLQPMTWDWFAKYADESYAVVSKDWLDANGDAPNHLDIAALVADLAALKA